MKKDFTQTAADAISSADAFINTIAPEQEPAASLFEDDGENRDAIRKRVDAGLKKAKEMREYAAQKPERICIMIPHGTAEKIRALAYLNRKSIAKEMRTAIEKYIADYERRNGIIEVR